MSEIKSGAFWRAVAAEFVGMLLFIFIAITAVIGTENKGENIAQEVKLSLAFALAIATLAHSLGHISGAHLNPAVTLGLLVSCQISAIRCVCYILAQMFGAVAASAIANGYGRGNTLGVNKLNTTLGPGFIIEFFATLQLVLCVIAVTDKRRSDVNGSAPLAIGLSVGLGHLAAIHFTGCGINPARSFGPAVIRGEMKDHWVYWLGPMCGGTAAALIYDFLLCPRMQNFRTRWNVLLNGPEDENDAGEIIREGNSSPGPSQWPKN
ncbi:aquaporin-1-like [Morone saxatilis]|uniref:aquaporin-1-like n=1 Tax=Morone saxatilis TaxID=34816 RepID=UPI0015E22D9A|nr:aquaporin-1-like [Morone saxatilis]